MKNEKFFSQPDPVSLLKVTVLFYWTLTILRLNKNSRNHSTSSSEPNVPRVKLRYRDVSSINYEREKKKFRKVLSTKDRKKEKDNLLNKMHSQELCEIIKIWEHHHLDVCSRDEGKKSKSARKAKISRLAAVEDYSVRAVYPDFEASYRREPGEQNSNDNNFLAWKHAVVFQPLGRKSAFPVIVSERRGRRPKCIR